MSVQTSVRIAANGSGKSNSYLGWRSGGLFRGTRRRRGTPPAIPKARTTRSSGDRLVGYWGRVLGFEQKLKYRAETIGDVQVTENPGLSKITERIILWRLLARVGASVSTDETASSLTAADRFGRIRGLV